MFIKYYDKRNISNLEIFPEREPCKNNKQHSSNNPTKRDSTNRN